MSDKEDKNIEQIGEEAASAEVGEQENSEPVAPQQPAAPAPEAAVAPAAIAYPAPPPARGSSAVAWFALLLVLALAGAAAWAVMEAQRREAVLLDKLAEVEAATGREQADLEKFSEGWQRKLNQGLEEIRGDMGRLGSGIDEIQGDVGRLDGGLGELSTGLQQVRGGATQQSQALDELSNSVSEARAELARFSANDRESWLLAEAGYLMRLANQRVIMAGDVASAQALLNSADKVLLELDDVSLHEVRAGVAADLAALRAVPQLDVEGIYLRLAALIEQADELKIFEMPEGEAQPEQVAAEDWQDRLEQGYEQALVKLSSYIAIRRRDVPMEVLMAPQWEGLVRQNLRMLMELAQVALLSGNQALYRESLERSLHWVDEFAETDEAGASAMSGEIKQLAGLEVAVNMPDISRSLSAMDDVLKQKMQQGGEE